jgi:D-beta-D-heptose 7-phosphate kinase/D-beta-D-heptose 1-phosphate adenosyltransferase
MAVGDDDEISAAARKLITEHKITSVLATRSGDGMSLIGADSFDHFTAEAHEVFDVSGAGDTVAATIAASLAAGVDLNEAVHLANTAAGIVIAKVGTAVAYASDIIEALHQQEFSLSEVKILSLNSAIEHAEVWRLKGHRIGFTNGCFDLLHPGHISTIAKAKAACDRLIIGLNNDVSVKRLKGEDRPVQSEAARAQVLAGLENVDVVVIFSEDTPANIIDAIKPEVFVKGADYSVEEIPEAAIVQAYGGEIVLAELEDGHSTTATIAKLNK